MGAYVCIDTIDLRPQEISWANFNVFHLHPSGAEINYKNKIARVQRMA
jgi:hypothetical protein